MTVHEQTLPRRPHFEQGSKNKANLLGCLFELRQFKKRMHQEHDHFLASLN
jgi:hypothetical protein